MLYSVESNKDIENTALALEKAASRGRLGSFKVYDLKQELAKEGIDLKRECRIYQFSKCEELKLPVTISVFTEANHVKIATLKPSEFLGFYRQSEMADVINDIEKVLLEVIEEALK